MLLELIGANLLWVLGLAAVAGLGFVAYATHERSGYERDVHLVINAVAARGRDASFAGIDLAEVLLGLPPRLRVQPGATGAAIPVGGGFLGVELPLRVLRYPAGAALGASGFMVLVGDGATPASRAPAGCVRLGMLRHARVRAVRVGDAPPGSPGWAQGVALGSGLLSWVSPGAVWAEHPVAPALELGDAGRLAAVERRCALASTTVAYAVR